jgi:predicted metal-dependent HD superfamily phosphohydrolase
VDLVDRWPLPGSPELADRLLEAYSEQGRWYHDVRHLAEVLDRLDELAAAGTPFEREPVRLAAWFHDAVYDGRPAAEERSARWAEEALTEVGIAPATVREVARLVRLTEHHSPAPDDPSGAALSDADLAVLASTPERYAGYAADVRREYDHVPDREFVRGRSAVLRALLAADRLFRTDHGFASWEQAARRNVEAELVELEELSGRTTGP